MKDLKTWFLCLLHVSCQNNQIETAFVKVSVNNVNIVLYLVESSAFFLFFCIFQNNSSFSYVIFFLTFFWHISLLHSRF